MKTDTFSQRSRTGIRYGHNWTIGIKRFITHNCAYIEKKDTCNDAYEWPHSHSHTRPQNIPAVETRLHAVRHASLDQDIQRPRTKGQACSEEVDGCRICFLEDYIKSFRELILNTQSREWNCGCHLKVGHNAHPDSAGDSHQEACVVQQL